MRRTARLALLIALVALPLTACGGSTDAVSDTAAHSGDPKAGFKLTTLDGDEVGPADYEGKVVLVDFWATWCIPCHAQAEVLKSVHAELGDAEVQVLAVDVGETETQVRGFVEKKPFPYPVLLDPESELADSLGVYSLPTLMVIDTRGEVTYFEPGILGENDLCRVLADAGTTRTC